MYDDLLKNIQARQSGTGGEDTNPYQMPVMAPAKKKPEETRSLMSPVTDYGAGIVSGFRHRIPEMVGQAGQFVGIESGKELAEWGRKGEDPGRERGAFYQAGEMTPASAAIPMAMNAIGTGLMLIPHPYAKGVGGVIKVASYALTPLVFGLSQAQQTKETAEARDVDPGAAPYITGGIEFSGEAIGTYALNRLLGPLAPSIPLIKAGAKNLLKTSIGRFGIHMLTNTLPTEIATEVLQQAGQAAVEKKWGIRPDAQPIKEAMSVIAPTAIMTLVSGSAGHTVQRIQANEMLKAVSSPDVDPAKRKDVAAAIAGVISKEEENKEKPVANTWLHYANHQIDNGQPIDIDRPLTELKSGPRDMLLDKAEKDATAKGILTGEDSLDAEEAAAVFDDETLDLYSERTPEEAKKPRPAAPKTLDQLEDDDIFKRVANIEKAQKAGRMTERQGENLGLLKQELDDRGIGSAEEFTPTTEPAEAEKVSREPKEDLTKEFDRGWEGKPEDDQDTWLKMVDHFEAVRAENKPKIDSLNEEFKPLKSKRDKESIKRKKKIKAELERLKGEPDVLHVSYENKVIDIQVALQEEANKMALKAGVPEDAIEDFADAFSMEISGQPAYAERNFGITKKQILDELIEEYGGKPAPSPKKTDVAPEGKEAEKIDAAAQEAATSPENDLPEPTEAQKEAGNYKKGHVSLQGMDISIENPKGSERSGIDPSGKKWSVTMKHHYGYFKRSEGKDGDQIDVFIGSHPESDKAYIVDQVDPGTGKFDEHKTLLGFNNKAEAEKAYLSNYEKGWKGLGAITELPIDEFKKWVGDGKRKKAPFAKESKADEGEKAEPAEEKALGKNLNGEDVYEDERGRYTLHGDIKSYAPRPITTYGASMENYSPEELYKAFHHNYLTKDELKQFNERPDIRDYDYLKKIFKGEKEYEEIRDQAVEKLGEDVVKAVEIEADAAEPAKKKPTEKAKQPKIKHKKEAYPSFIDPDKTEYRCYGYGVHIVKTGPNSVGGTGWEWYAFEPIKGDIAFGLVHGFETEWGSFSLSELKENGVRFITDPKDLRTIMPPVGWTLKEPEKPAEIPKAKKIEPEKPIASPSLEIADKVAEYLEKDSVFTIDAKRLRAWGDEAFGGSLSQGKYSIKDLYDAMELGVNKLILDRFITISQSPQEAVQMVKHLKKIIVRLPTQTSRTEDTDEFQQFSTPPPLAYVANWVANIEHGEDYLEPSAGVGGMAVFGKIAGAKVSVNELSDLRMRLLKSLPFDEFTSEDAAQLNNVAALKDVNPSVIVMNPPFSATAGRVQGRRRTAEGASHIEQALKKLLTNGRLVAIVGQGMARDKPAFRKWWNKIEAEYNVRANIGISGQEYKKYGTTFDNQILVIDKTGPTADPNNYPTGKVDQIKDLIPLLKGVRDGRIPQRERIAGEPGGKESAETPGSKPALLPSGGATGDRPGRAEGAQAGVAGKPGSVSGVVEPGGGHGIPGRGTRPDKGLPEKAEPGRSGERGAATTGQQVISGADRISAAEGSSGELQIRAIEKEKSGEFSESYYENYKPERLKIKGSIKHPTPLVQSAAMSAVTPPAPSYEISIPNKVVTSGKLSDIQIESIVYTGQAHEQKLPSGERKGFFIGDGTGVGKGREIAGVLMDNWKKGRKKGVWITEKAALFEDAQRDVTGIGWDKNLVFPWFKIKSGVDIRSKEGILFGTYDTLKSAPQKEGAIPRIDQLINWLGKDFDGVIALDESHNMGNAIAMRGLRGTIQPSAKALAGVALQKALPNARILYVSATGATEVKNLSYCTRLDLWGEGTPFPNVGEFINNIAGGGVAAMEMIAQNMKATGSYTSRSLSYDGVEHDRVEHKLTENQREQYNKAAGAWRTVLENINEALEITGGAKSGKAKSSAMSLFWGSNQRFFNQIITSMQLPSVINKMHDDLKAGNSVVIQLVNTLEAAQQRALGKLNEEDSLEDLDLSPFDDLMQLVDRGFPVQQYHEVMDEEGNIRMEPTMDSEGNHVENGEAVAKREQLLDELGALRGEFADGPIDQIIAEFGTETVAEVTGRSRRVVDAITERGTEKVIEKRSDAKTRADADAFMNGKKRILIFSEKGGTGRSYHADRDAKNQQKRIHYLLQPGWRADKAIQGLGRTHRSNQVHPPKYYLVTTDLKGQARFVSSIARRLDQLGALTKGARETGSQGIFQAKDNLETMYAEDALQVLLRDIYYRKVPNFTVAEFEKQTAIKLVDNEGNLLASQVTIKKFLNRILSMEIDKQNELFSEFSIRLDDVIDAHAEAGTLDVGLETLKADKIEKVGDEVVHTDQKSGATTRYVQVDITNPAPILQWDEAEKFAAADGFYQNVKSKKVWATRQRAVLNRKTGDINDKYILQSPTFTKQHLDPSDIEDAERWTKVSNKEAEGIWNENVAELPKTITERRHLVTGVLLPVWNRMIGHPRIMRIRTDDGEAMIGRMIAPKDLRETLKRLGATAKKIKATPKQIHTQILANGYRYNLANGWEIKRKRVAGDYRIEIDGPSYSDFNILKNYGVFSERIYYQTRYFIPSDAKGYNAIEKIIANTPVVDEIPPHGQYQIGKSIPVVGNESLIDLIRKLPFLAKQTVGLSNDGSVWVRTKNGQGFTVRSVEAINPDEMSLTIHHGKMLESGEFIKGKYQDGAIDLQRDLADEWTLAHETVHWMEDIGLINKRDIFTLEQRIKAMAKKGQWDSEGRPVGGVEDRAVFVSKMLRDRSQRGPVGEILQKIADFVDALVNLAKPTARGLVRKIESGKIFDRPGGRPQTLVPEYQKTADRWHSQMRNYLFQKLTNGKPENLAKQIEAWANKGAFKKEELEWSGVLDWLKEQKGKVTKQQVLDYLAENNVRVEEVEKGGVAMRILVYADHHIVDVVDEPEGWTVTFQDGKEVYVRDFDAENEVEAREVAIDDINHFPDDYTPEVETKFSQYVIPGGENYRELLLTLPQERVSSKEADIKKRLQEMRDQGLRGTPEFKELVHQGTLERKATQDLRPHYTSTHSDQWGGVPNILAWIRFDERTGPNGEKILHIAEIQSDWHQEARKRGYKKTGSLPGGYTVNKEFDNDDNWVVRNPEGRLVTMGEDKAKAIENAMRVAGVPDAPFKKTWPLLTIKRMVRYAAENGFDAVSWDTGTTNIDRYEEALRQSIDEIRYEPAGEGLWEVSAIKNGKDVFNDDEIDINRVEELLGKDIAEKIEADKGVLIPDQPYREWRSISGEGLSIGGEGMKGFYDKMLPSIANKFFNKKAWGKAKVGTGKVSNLNSRLRLFQDGPNWNVIQEAVTGNHFDKRIGKFKSRKEAQEFMDNWTPGESVHSLPITPEMKSKALSEGMPLFQKTYKRGKEEDWTTPLPGGRKTPPGGKPPPSDILSDEVRKNMGISKGLPKPGFVERFEAGTEELKKQRHHFPELQTIEDKDERGALNDLLRQHQEVPETAKHKAITLIHSFMKDLSKKDYEVFRMNIILADMVRDINNGLTEDGKLPFGFTTTEEVIGAYEQYASIARNTPGIAKALKRRNKVINDIKMQLIRAKLLKKEVADEKDYFHHQILIHWQAKYGLATGSKDVRTHWRPWMAKRMGSAENYNTEYAQVEFLAVSQQLAQLETVETLKRVKKESDIYPKVKAATKEKNLKNFMEKLRKAGMIELDEFGNEKDPLMPWKQKIAMSNMKLAEMASRGTLEYDSEWTEIIEALADSYDAWKANKADIPDYPRPGVSDPRWFHFLSYLINTKKPGSNWAATVFKAIRGRDNHIKNTLGDDFLTYRNMVPEGYVEWHPDPKKGWFWANTVSDNLLQRLVSREIDPTDVEFRKILAKGRDLIWIIPKGLSDTLDTFREFGDPSHIGRLADWAQGAWKQYILLNPYSVVRYNINNMSGDLDATLAYAPEISRKYSMKAAKDLWKWHRHKKLPANIQKELDRARRLGVVGSGFAVQEVDDVLRIISMDKFVRDVILDEKPNWFNPKTWGQKYWTQVKQVTVWRENILRLAAWRYFKDNADKNLYGASKPDEVNAVRDPEERAAKLARELLGDYGNISRSGEWVRKRLIPFYSWMEINAPRYVYMMRNTKYESREQGSVKGRVAAIGAKKMIMSASKMAIRSTMLYGLVMLWNMVMFPKEEEEIAESGRNQLHIILGRREDGSIISLRFQGALSDALSFFGLEDWPQDIKDVSSGKSTIQEKLKEVPISFLNRWIQGIRPEIKLFGELISGTAIYPDFRKPIPIRDRLEYALRTFKLDKIYREVLGRPGRGKTPGTSRTFQAMQQFVEDLKQVLLYESDPGILAYYDARKMAFDWLAKMGDEKARGGTPTKKGNALYWYKQAMKYGDLDAAQRYLQKYYELGGTRKGKIQSIRLAHPLSSIPKMKRYRFKESLTPTQRSVMDRAMEWYDKTYIKKRQGER
jgi:NTP hydrolase family protein/strawberry notch-like protein/inorganic pyrophosphatase-like protein